MFSLFGRLFGKKAVDTVREIQIQDVELTDEEIEKMRDDEDYSDSASTTEEVN